MKSYPRPTRTVYIAAAVYTLGARPSGRRVHASGDAHVHFDQTAVRDGAHPIQLRESAA